MLFFFTWVLQLVAAEKVYDHTVASIKNVELDIKALAASLSEVHLPTFSHAHELLAAAERDGQFSDAVRQVVDVHVFTDIEFAEFVQGPF